MDDVYDEITDRFGTPPKSVERLLSVALCRALAEAARIPRIEHRGSQILFFTDKPDLSVWSMVLSLHEGRLCGSSVSGAPIAYRLRSKEEPIGALLSVLKDYYNEMNSESEGK